VARAGCLPSPAAFVTGTGSNPMVLGRQCTSRIADSQSLSPAITATSVEHCSDSTLSRLESSQANPTYTINSVAFNED